MSRINRECSILSSRELCSSERQDDVSKSATPYEDDVRPSARLADCHPVKSCDGDSDHQGPTKRKRNPKSKMQRRRTSSLSSHDTGFPEQFIGTTHRHPEARILTTPWEPKEIDVIRRARQLSMLRNQSLLSRVFGLHDIDDENDEDDCHSLSIGGKKRPALSTPRNLAPASVTIPVYPSGSGAGRPILASGSISPTGSGYVDNSEDTRSNGVTLAGNAGSPHGPNRANSYISTHSGNHGYSIGHSRNPSHDSTISSTSSSMGYDYTWDSANPRSLAPIERTQGLFSKISDWKIERRGRRNERKTSQSNSVKS